MFQNQLSAFQRRQEKAQALQKDTAAAQLRSQKHHQSDGAAGAPPAAAKGRALDPTNWKQDKDYYLAKMEAQRAPLGQKLKKVVELLQKERRGMTLQEIEDATLVDATTSTELQAALLKNPKVAVEGDKYRYKAKHDLRSKDDLLRLIRDHKDGLRFEEIADSYPEVRAHVDELRAVAQIWILSSSEGSEEIVLYPNDPKLQIRVDEDVAQLVRAIDLPSDFTDIEKELKRSGQKPTTSAVQQQYNISHAHTRAQQRPKGKRKRASSKPGRTTNDHLDPELFQDPPPTK